MTGISACGTVRQQTKGFPELKVPSRKSKRPQSKLGLIKDDSCKFIVNDFHVHSYLYCRGDSIICQNGPLVAVSWFDNKFVDVLATICQPGDMGIARRKTKRWDIH